MVLPGGIEPPSSDFQSVAMTTSAKAALKLVDEVRVELTQQLRVGYSHLSSPVPSSSINLVEDRGIEPLTLTCKASVFPISTNPPIIISHTVSNVSYKANCIAMQPHLSQNQREPACFIRYHLYSAVIASVSSGRPPIYNMFIVRCQVLVTWAFLLLLSHFALLTAFC